MPAAALIGVLALLLVVAGVVVVALVVTSGDDEDSDDESARPTVSSIPEAASSTPSPASQPSGSADPSSVPATTTPLDDDARADVVAAAEHALAAMLEASGPTYDADVAAAAQLMTDSMAQEYLGLAADIRDKMLKEKSSRTVTVDASGVVAGLADRPQVLVALTQIVGDTNVFKFRMLLTMESAGSSWLLDSADSDPSMVPSTEPDAERRAALEAATALATAYVNVDHRTFDADSERVLDLATESFAKRYLKNLSVVKRTTREQRSVMTGEVIAAGLIAFDADSAEVLVASTGEVRNKASDGDPAARNFTLRLTLERIDGIWLVNDMQTEL